MPSYTFKCDNCEYELDLICSMKEYDEETADLSCPECKSSDFYRDYFSDCVVTAVREVKTLGQLAERNAKKYGKEKCQKMMEDFKTKKEPSNKPLPEGITRVSSYEDTPRLNKDEAKKRAKQYMERRKI